MSEAPIVNTGGVDCPVCRAPAGAQCRTVTSGAPTSTHPARAALARRYYDNAARPAPAAPQPPPDPDPDPEPTVLIDLVDTDLNPPSDDLILRALRTRAGAYGLAVRIAPADHAPDRAVFPLRLELVDGRDGRRVIAGYTATAPGGSASTGLRTLLAVLP
jgi:hypothetical protein